MIYPAEEEGGPSKRARTEAKTGPAEKLYKNLSGNWPMQLHEYPIAEEGRIPRHLLVDELQLHAHHHNYCGVESFYVHGFLQEKRTRPRYGFFLNFYTKAIVSNLTPPTKGERLMRSVQLHWAVVDLDKGKYYRFSGVDHRGPLLLSTLIAKEEVTGPTHLMQAALEQFNSDCLVCPDQEFDEEVDLGDDSLHWNLNCGGNTLQFVSVGEEEVRRESSYYKVHLEGTTNEGDPDKDLKMRLDLQLQPRNFPLLDGNKGIVSSGGFEHDYFSFVVPHVKITSGALVVEQAADDLEVIRIDSIAAGDAWLEHRFGEAVPFSPEEAQLLLERRRAERATGTTTRERCAIRLMTTDGDAVAITQVRQPNGEPMGSAYSITQRRREPEGFFFDKGVSLQPDPASTYVAADTKVRFPRRWTIATPMAKGGKLEATLTAKFTEQEFTTFYASPSFWEGVVAVEGTLTQADGTATRVVGDGFMYSDGEATDENVEHFFNNLHKVGMSEVENKPAVAACLNSKAVSEGPGLAALVAISTVYDMSNNPLRDEHTVVLSALIGAYGFLYHHGGDEEKATEALQWCYERWMAHFGQGQPLDYKTLLLRAFMMRELEAVVKAKCVGWLPRGVQALDIAVPLDFVARETRQVPNGCTLPTREQLETCSSGSDLVRLKSLFDGRWRFEKGHTVGSMNSVLVEQNVNVFWRNVLSRLRPTIQVVCDPKSHQVSLRVSTILDTYRRTIHANGQEYQWDTTGRGRISSRACVMDEGRQLFVESKINGGLERIWYHFRNEGKTLVEKIYFYTSPTETETSAYCQRYYTFDTS